MQNFESSPLSPPSTSSTSSTSASPSSTTTPSTAAALPVSELVAMARRAVEDGIPPMWVGGEVMNFTRAASGHWYFVLRDDRAQADCVMMARFAALARPPRNGEQVEIFGRPTFYAPRGRFQLAGQFIRRAGAGRLHQIFTERKRAFAQRGWFDPADKRPLPVWPRQIGVVCSPQGAALRDILKTAAARLPAIPIVIYPAPAQGDDAAPRIAAAIRAAGERAECDALLLCRGGGGMEELWAYNEEEVVAAIVDSPIPVVTGVGHETDETLADYAADLRAPTPTAAAAAAVPDGKELRREAVLRARNLQRETLRRWDELAQRADYAARALARPTTALAEKSRRLTAAATQLIAAAAAEHARARGRARDLAARLLARSPTTAIAAAEAELRAVEKTWRAETARLLRDNHARLEAAARALAASHPDNILRRGFSIVRGPRGAPVTDAGQLQTGDRLTMQFARGAADAQVKKTRPTPAA